jgi:Leucine-rich repeat (LRR) protein
MKTSISAKRILRGFIAVLILAFIAPFGGCDSKSRPQEANEEEIQRLTEACQGMESSFARAESCIALAKLRGASHLDLNGFGLEQLPPSLFELHGLTELLLNDNRLSSLPEAFGQLSELQTLSLERNQ